ncbi:hypothetical protein BsWGS_14489 [Bradybaena similaris]
MTQMLLVVPVLLWAGSMLPRARCECNYAVCQSQIPTNGTKAEQCTQAKEAIKCAVSTLLTNPDCTENIKSLVRRKVEDGNKQVLDLCGGGGAAALVAPMFVCLVLSGLAYFVRFF